MQPRIIAMISMFGYKGYGWFWTIVEMLRGEENYSLVLDEYTLVALQAKLSTPSEGITKKEQISDFIKFCTDAGIFFIDDGYLSARFLTDQMHKMESVIEARKAAGKLGGRPRKKHLPAPDENDSDFDDENVKTNWLANAKQEDTICQANQKQKKPDKIRLDKRREDQKDIHTSQQKNSPEQKLKLAEFVSVSPEELAKLHERFGESKVARMVEVLDNYKGSSGKKYKSDYRAILNWVVEKVEKEDSHAKTRASVDFAADPAGVGYDSATVEDLQTATKRKRSV